MKLFHIKNKRNISTSEQTSTPDEKQTGDNNPQIADDEHVLVLPETKKFELDGNFDYLRKSILPTAHYKAARACFHPILFCMHKSMLGIKVEGTENLKLIKKTGAVIISNHVHPLDCTVLDCILRRRRVYYTTLQSNFKIPFARYLIRLLGGVPIPEDIHLLKYFSQSMHSAIANGDCVVVYPEGALHPYCKNIRAFKIGAFRLARECNCPILPVVMTFRKPDGVYKLYKNKPCLTVKILPPVMPEPKCDDICDKTTERKLDNELRSVCSEHMKDCV